jgi:hypothetical protein
MSIRSKVVKGIVAAAVIGGSVAGPLVATAGTAASAAPVTTMSYQKPIVLPAWNLNGVNTIDLTYNGTTYTYLIHLHQSVFDNVLVGTLYDKYLAAEGAAGGDPSGILALHGLVVGNNVILVTNYPAGDPQAARSFNFVVTPVSFFKGNVAGTWDETGSEAGTGSASLVHPVFR